MTKGRAWLIMPVGASHGWGICGTYLALEMDRLARIGLVTEALDSAGKDDPSHHRRLSELHVPLEDVPKAPAGGCEYLIDGPLLQAIEGPNLKPWLIRAKAPKRVAYAFFERTELGKKDVLEAQGYFDWIVAGSTWCEEVMRAHGMVNVSTILQGIDPVRFPPSHAEKERYGDRFVVFSGGKIELRKAQDLVIRAFKVLQDRHRDVLLVNSWFNMWDGSVRTMALSPYIRFHMPKGNYFTAIEQLLVANGIDPQNVVTLPPLPHAQMAQVYRDTDCGLFPNRCEGGTNLVLMEYMACARPAIASFCTGHKDVVAEENSMPLRSIGKLNIQDQAGRVIEQWDNPDLEEVIEKLEWAYQNRDEIKEIGKKAGQAMQSLTWEKAAKAFLELLQGESAR